MARLKLDSSKLKARARDQEGLEQEWQEKREEALATALPARVEVLPPTASLATLGERVRQISREMVQLQQLVRQVEAQWVVRALEMGRLLEQAKALTENEPGGFRGWLQSLGLSRSHAYNCLQIWQQQDRLFLSALVPGTPCIEVEVLDNTGVQRVGHLPATLTVREALRQVRSAISREQSQLLAPQLWVKVRPKLEMLQEDSESLDRHAEEQGISRDELILRIVKDWLKRRRG